MAFFPPLSLRSYSKLPINDIVFLFFSFVKVSCAQFLIRFVLTLNSSSFFPTFAVDNIQWQFYSDVVMVFVCEKDSSCPFFTLVL